MANNLETQVLRLIGEDVENPDAFSNIAPVRDSINDAVQELAIITGGVKGTYHLPLSNANFYRMNFVSGGFAWVTDAWLVSQRRRLDQTDVARLSSQNPRWMIDSGSPESYFQIGADIVGVYRRPTGTTEVLRLDVVMTPARYTTDTERVRVRREFEVAVINYAVSEYYASRGDAKQAMEWFGRYLEITGLADAQPIQSDDRPRMAVDARLESRDEVIR